MKKNSYTTGELATRLKASIEGSDQVVLNSVSDLKNAHSGQISFLSHPKYEKQIIATWLWSTFKLKGPIYHTNEF